MFLQACVTSTPGTGVVNQGPLPRMRPGYNTSLPPGSDQVTTPPPPRIRPGYNTPHRMRPGYNTSLPPRMRPGYNTPPPPPKMRPGYNTSPRDYAQVGGTHPTGMHSCFLDVKPSNLNVWQKEAFCHCIDGWNFFCTK